MNAEADFEKWWDADPKRDYQIAPDGKIVAREAYLAATKATAAHCVEICRHIAHEQQETGHYAAAIKQEFDLD